MKDQKYWQRRAVRYERDWNKRCAETVEKRLARHYEKALSAIKDDILQLYATFAKDNGLDFNEARRALSSREFKEWRMSMREYIEANDAGLTRELNNLAMQPRITRLEKLYGETLQELDRLGRNVSDDMRNFLSGAYKDSYSRDIFDLVKVGGMAVAWAKVDSPSVEKVLAARWSGKNYSQRIWTNTRLLSGVIRETVATGVHRGLSISQLARQVEDKMHGGYSNAVRLVRTEMSFVNIRRTRIQWKRQVLHGMNSSQRWTIAHRLRVAVVTVKLIRWKKRPSDLIIRRYIRVVVQPSRLSLTA